MGVAIYKGENHVASRLWAVDRSKSDYLQVVPPQIMNSIATKTGEDYLKTNGVNLNAYRCRFIKTDTDDELNCQVVYLAGKNDPAVPDQPAAAWVFCTPAGSQIVVAVGPGQANGAGYVMGVKIVEALIGTGY